MSLGIESYVLPEARVSYFENVKRIIYGAGSYKAVGSEAKRLGRNGTALLVTDKGVTKAGLAEKVREVVEKEGLRVDVYDELSAEPTLESARKITEVVRGAKYSVIIGVGGGTVMDSAKVAAVMATNLGDVSNYLAYTEDRVKEKPLPKILIPTTAGTGSEVSMYAVIVDEKGVKNFITSPSVLADVAIVDPLMTITCPPRQTAASGMDALAHSMENILSLGFTPLSDMYGLQSISLIAANLRTAYYWGDNLRARYNMSLAALLGGLAMGATPAGANIGHCISEAIGPIYKIPHGIACAIVTPYMMEYNLPACIERLAMVASYMGLDVHGLPLRKAAIEAIKFVKELVEDLELPISLKDVGVPKEDIPKIADYIMEERQHYYYLQTYNPRKPTKENITELLEKMYEGRILE
ncbi:MAG: iron-containing alcohol dehydrogenase [Candidatus Bathyarchaeia archaeon]